MKFVISFLLFINFAFDIYSIDFTGYAYKMGSDDLIYIEKHKTIQDSRNFNKLVETDYCYPDGKSFAKIKSDFSKDLFIPDVVFEDFRFKTQEELLYIKDKQLISMKFTDLKRNSSETNQFKLFYNMLAGQGFNNFLLRNFDSLLMGNIINVNFIVLASLDYYNFDIYMKPSKNDDIITFGLRVHNLLLRLLVSEIELDYTRSNRRLEAYRGLSNITNDRGKSQKVRIEYKY